MTHDLGRDQQALGYLRPVAGKTSSPYRNAARRLIARIEAGARRRRQEADRAELDRSHREAIHQAERWAEAHAALRRAEALRPGHQLNHYYRGYLAYQRGNPVAARRHFNRALAKKPDDPWSRYMVALCLEQGDPRRRRLLRRLARSRSKGTLERAARQALSRSGAPSGEGARWLAVSAEFGVGLDTNPALVTDGSTTGSAPVWPGQPSTFDGPEPAKPSLALALRGQLELEAGVTLAQGRRGGHQADGAGLRPRR